MMPVCNIFNQAHIWAGVIALFAGPTQFIGSIRLKWIKLHRLCGKVYVAAVLISSPLAFLVSFHSSIPLAILGTASQSILWFIMTFQAYRFIKAGRINQHRDYMTMSYALTLSAPVVRLGIVVFERGMGINYQHHYETLYPVLVWISFLPFIAVWFFTKGFLKGSETDVDGMGSTDAWTF